MHPHHGVPIIGANSMSSIACTMSEVPTYYGEPIALWSFCWLLLTCEKPTDKRSSKKAAATDRSRMDISRRSCLGQNAQISWGENELSKNSSAACFQKSQTVVGVLSPPPPCGFDSYLLTVSFSLGLQITARDAKRKVR